MESINNEVYLLVVEWDNFYESKEFDSYAFMDIESAQTYMNDLMESIKLEFMERFECETEDQLMNEYLEITNYGALYPHVSLYVDDDCNISIYVQKKPVLKFK